MFIGKTSPSVGKKNLYIPLIVPNWNIPLKYAHASYIDGARNKIHPTIAKENVKSIFGASFHVASLLVYFRFFPNKINGRNNNA